jgi:phage tail sheath protein FI
MVEQFLHGVETIERDASARPVSTVKSAVIGLIGTAPDAVAETWPLNTPIAIAGERGVPSGLGAAGELKDALDAIFDQAQATVIAVRVAPGASLKETMGAVIGDRVALTGLHAFRRAAVDLGLKPRLLVAPGYTSQRPADGITSITPTAQGDDYVQETTTVTIAGGGGVGARAAPLVEGGKVTAVVVLNPGTGYGEGVTATVQGAGAGATLQVNLGQVANPVVAELLGVAERLRAMIAADGPNTTKEAAVAYRLDWASDRIMIVDPWVKAYKASAVVVQPPSARVVGLQAYIDQTRGFWHSPSNQVLNGVIGVARPIEWGLNDPETEANYLNERHVTTVIRDYETGGYKLWGNRVASSDPLKLFWPVRRTHDMIVDSIELASLAFVDRPFSPQLLLDIAETVNAYLRSLRQRGAILGGRCWLDPALNTPDQMAAGKLLVSYDAEGPAPIEHLVFEFSRNTGYYRELTEQAAREVARLAA